ncbi:uncharacterized protein VTP21DRAFT_8503 [Calcarisporiella thermophila]|uniref:uncharacterized protein n=1 Tax=Calcarisporiella thermophila TaxID=911321 RepID=UPI00374470B4
MFFSALRHPSTRVFPHHVHRCLIQPRRSFATTTSGKPQHTERNWQWWRDWTVRMAVFAVTGSSSLYVTRPILKNVLGVEGSWRDGPNSFRAAYVVTTIPVYSAMLFAFGALAGQRVFFTATLARMWGRLLPKALSRRFVK